MVGTWLTNSTSNIDSSVYTYNVGNQRTAVIRTGELQLRPVLMTCVVAGVGLLPAALSSGIGSQVQKPLAIVVVSGMTLAPLVILVTLPVLISFFSRRAR